MRVGCPRIGGATPGTDEPGGRFKRPDSGSMRTGADGTALLVFFNACLGASTRTCGMAKGEGSDARFAGS